MNFFFKKKHKRQNTERDPSTLAKHIWMSMGLSFLRLYTGEYRRKHLENVDETGDIFTKICST